MAAAAPINDDAALLRTFVAIDLPDAVKTEFAARQTALRSHLRGQGLDNLLRWSASQGMHLTLRFLGDTSPAQCRTLAERLRRVVAAYAPLALAVGAPGVFPYAAQPRVLWIGLAGDLERLAALQAKVEDAVQAVGFAAEPKPFAPHITLARVRRDAGRDALRALGRALASAPSAASATHFTVGHLVHYRSDLQPRGSVYTPLVTIPFGAAGVQPGA